MMNLQRGTGGGAKQPHRCVVVWGGKQTMQDLCRELIKGPKNFNRSMKKPMQKETEEAATTANLNVRVQKMWSADAASLLHRRHSDFLKP